MAPTAPLAAPGHLLERQFLGIRNSGGGLGCLPSNTPLPFPQHPKPLRLEALRGRFFLSFRSGKSLRGWLRPAALPKKDSKDFGTQLGGGRGGVVVMSKASMKFI